MLKFSKSREYSVSSSASVGDRVCSSPSGFERPALPSPPAPIAPVPTPVDVAADPSGGGVVDAWLVILERSGEGCF